MAAIRENFSRMMQADTSPRPHLNSSRPTLSPIATARDGSFFGNLGAAASARAYESAPAAAFSPAPVPSMLASVTLPPTAHGVPTGSALLPAGRTSAYTFGVGDDFDQERGGQSRLRSRQQHGQESFRDPPIMHGASYLATPHFSHQIDYYTAAKGADVFVDGISIWRLFPTMFLYCCCLAFLVPIWGTVHLGYDPNVVYWLGTFCRWTAGLPLLFVAGYFEHLRRRAPSKLVVLACVLIPCIMLVALNDKVLLESSDMGMQMFSTDCDTLEEKRALQRSWDAAELMFSKCLEDTVRDARAQGTANLTVEEAAGKFRVQDCEEYSVARRGHEKDWDYLWYLEEEHSCAGWCALGQRLWTSGLQENPKDSCSVVVSQVFSEKVSRTSYQTVVMSWVILVGTVVFLIAVGPFLRARGIDW